MSKSPVTVIVGMGPGLSAALAERFASAGHHVVGLARTPGKSADSVAALNARGLQVEVRTADAGDLAALHTALASIERDIGPVEVLIYNAYRSSYAPPSAVRPEDVVNDFRVNVAGALAATQAVLPGMRQRGRGTVLFTGGGLALDPTGWLEASSLAIGKAGLRSLALTLNKELSPMGVHVGTVTVAGMIKPGTAFAPAMIAAAFWQMHQASASTRPAELLYQG